MNKLVLTNNFIRKDEFIQRSGRLKNEEASKLI